MKIQYVSDLHISPYRSDKVSLITPANDVDVLVLAGDISAGIHGLAYASLHSETFKHVIYITGNHEYYGTSVDKLDKELQSVALPSNVYLLNNSSVIIGDTEFFGSTLFSEIRPTEKYMVGVYINDFYHIRGNSLDKHNARFADSAAAIRKFLEAPTDNKTVVISHFLPSFECVHDKYAESPINSYFASDLLGLLESTPDLWIHAHTHVSVDITVNNTRVVCNPKGYTNGSTLENENENPEYNEQKVITL